MISDTHQTPNNQDLRVKAYDYILMICIAVKKNYDAAISSVDTLACLVNKTTSIALPFRCGASIVVLPSVGYSKRHLSHGSQKNLVIRMLSNPDPGMDTSSLPGVNFAFYSRTSFLSIESLGRAFCVPVRHAFSHVIFLENLSEN